MATLNKFDNFVKALADGTHHLGTDVIKVMLTNTAPVATNTFASHITEIAAGNGYVAGGNICAYVSGSQTSGTYTLILADPAAWVATGGSMASFRYAVMYNNSTSNKDLIGWLDYGSTVTLADTETFTVDLNQATGIIQLA